ncbi:MAG: 1-acyl-sn-glycerol-3-phosphate acyltransferase [Candidatus Omnitrophica bacterium]|nr:1-acyl-sn-glycerol-3-phosphate acyltransferase [Candidatus Omnitrophota bacterium]
MLYWIGYLIMALVDGIYLRTEYINRKILPVSSSYIIASNHISNLDPFVLGMCQRRRFAFLAKEELFEKKWLGFILRNFGAFPIKRDAADFGAIRETLRRIKLQQPTVLFPEGTRGAGTREKKINPGVGMIAVKSGVPVVPVFVQNTDKALPNGAKWFKRHKVIVTIGEPIGFKSRKDYQQIALEIMAKIEELAKSQK